MGGTTVVWTEAAPAPIHETVPSVEAEAEEEAELDGPEDASRAFAQAGAAEANPQYDVQADAPPLRPPRQG
ncbi:MAG: hypothetical protein AAGK21_06165 [Bacteroidota bacterium]